MAEELTAQPEPISQALPEEDLPNVASWKAKHSARTPDNFRDDYEMATPQERERIVTEMQGNGGNYNYLAHNQRRAVDLTNQTAAMWPDEKLKLNEMWGTVQDDPDPFPKVAAAMSLEDRQSRINDENYMRRAQARADQEKSAKDGVTWNPLSLTKAFMAGAHNSIGNFPKMASGAYIWLQQTMDLPDEPLEVLAEIDKAFDLGSDLGEYKQKIMDKGMSDFNLNLAYSVGDFAGLYGTIQVLRTIGSFVVGGAVGLVTENPVAAGLAKTIGENGAGIFGMAALETQGFYQNATDSGIDPPIAKKWATWHGPISGSIEYWESIYQRGKLGFGKKAGISQTIKATMKNGVIKDRMLAILSEIREENMQGFSEKFFMYQAAKEQFGGDEEKAKEWFTSRYGVESWVEAWAKEIKEVSLMTGSTMAVVSLLGLPANFRQRKEFRRGVADTLNMKQSEADILIDSIVGKDVNLKMQEELNEKFQAAVDFKKALHERVSGEILSMVGDVEVLGRLGGIKSVTPKSLAHLQRMGKEGEDALGKALKAYDKQISEDPASVLSEDALTVFMTDQDSQDGFFAGMTGVLRAGVHPIQKVQGFVKLQEMLEVGRLGEVQREAEQLRADMAREGYESEGSSSVNDRDIASANIVLGLMEEEQVTGALGVKHLTVTPELVQRALALLGVNNAIGYRGSLTAITDDRTDKEKKRDKDYDENPDTPWGGMRGFIDLWNEKTGRKPGDTGAQLEGKLPGITKDNIAYIKGLLQVRTLLPKGFDLSTVPRIKEGSGELGEALAYLFGDDVDAFWAIADRVQHVANNLDQIGSGAQMAEDIGRMLAATTGNEKQVKSNVETPTAEQAQQVQDASDENATDESGPTDLLEGKHRTFNPDQAPTSSFGKRKAFEAIVMQLVSRNGAMIEEAISPAADMTRSEVVGFIKQHRLDIDTKSGSKEDLLALIPEEWGVVYPNETPTPEGATRKDGTFINKVVKVYNSAFKEYKDEVSYVMKPSQKTGKHTKAAALANYRASRRWWDGLRDMAGEVKGTKGSSFQTLIKGLSEFTMASGVDPNDKASWDAFAERSRAFYAEELEKAKGPRKEVFERALETGFYDKLRKHAIQAKLVADAMESLKDPKLSASRRKFYADQIARAQERMGKMEKSMFPKNAAADWASVWTGLPKTYEEYRDRLHQAMLTSQESVWKYLKNHYELKVDHPFFRFVTDNVFLGEKNLAQAMGQAPFIDRIKGPDKSDPEFTRFERVTDQLQAYIMGSDATNADLVAGLLNNYLTVNAQNNDAISAHAHAEAHFHAVKGQGGKVRLDALKAMKRAKGIKDSLAGQADDMHGFRDRIERQAVEAAKKALKLVKGKAPMSDRSQFETFMISTGVAIDQLVKVSSLWVAFTQRFPRFQAQTAPGYDMFIELAATYMDHVKDKGAKYSDLPVFDIITAGLGTYMQSMGYHEAMRGITKDIVEASIPLSFLSQKGGVTTEDMDALNASGGVLAFEDQVPGAINTDPNRQGVRKEAGERLEEFKAKPFPLDPRDLTNVDDAPRTTVDKIVTDHEGRAQVKYQLESKTGTERLDPDKYVLPDNMQGVPVVAAVNPLMSKPDAEGVRTRIMAKRIGATNEIHIDQGYADEVFAGKNWTQPRILADGSIAEALAEDTFKTVDELIEWSLWHEQSHTVMEKHAGETAGDFETRVNNRAMENWQKSLNNPRSDLDIPIISDVRVGDNAPGEAASMTRDFWRSLGTMVPRMPDGILQVVSQIGQTAMLKMAERQNMGYIEFLKTSFYGGGPAIAQTWDEMKSSDLFKSLSPAEQQSIEKMYTDPKSSRTIGITVSTAVDRIYQATLAFNEKKSDAATVIHEIAHSALDIAKMEIRNKKDEAMLRILVERVTGGKVNVPMIDYQYSAKVQEQIANLVVQYVGGEFNKPYSKKKQLSRPLRKALSRFKRYLGRLVSSLQSADPSSLPPVGDITTKEVWALDRLMGLDAASDAHFVADTIFPAEGGTVEQTLEAYSDPVAAKETEDLLVDLATNLEDPQSPTERVDQDIEDDYVAQAIFNRAETNYVSNTDLFANMPDDLAARMEMQRSRRSQEVIETTLKLATRTGQFSHRMQNLFHKIASKFSVIDKIDHRSRVYTELKFLHNSLNSVKVQARDQSARWGERVFAGLTPDDRNLVGTYWRELQYLSRMHRMDLQPGHGMPMALDKEDSQVFRGLAENDSILTDNVRDVDTTAYYLKRLEAEIGKRNLAYVVDRMNSMFSAMRFLMKEGGLYDTSESLFFPFFYDEGMSEQFRSFADGTSRVMATRKGAKKTAPWEGLKRRSKERFGEKGKSFGVRAANTIGGAALDLFALKKVGGAEFDGSYLHGRIGSRKFPITDAKLVMHDYMSRVLYDQLRAQKLYEFLTTNGMTADDFQRKHASLQKQQAALSKHIDHFRENGYEPKELLESLYDLRKHQTVLETEFKPISVTALEKSAQGDNIVLTTTTQLRKLMNVVFEDPDFYDENIPTSAKVQKLRDMEFSEIALATFTGDGGEGLEPGLEKALERIRKQRQAAEPHVMEWEEILGENPQANAFALGTSASAKMKNVISQVFMLDGQATIMEMADIYAVDRADMLLPKDVNEQLMALVEPDSVSGLAQAIKKFNGFFAHMVLFSSGQGYNAGNLTSDLTAVAQMSPRFFKDTANEKFFSRAAEDLLVFISTGTASPRLLLAMRSGYLDDTQFGELTDVSAQDFANKAMTVASADDRSSRITKRYLEDFFLAIAGRTRQDMSDLFHEGEFKTDASGNAKRILRVAQVMSGLVMEGTETGIIPFSWNAKTAESFPDVGSFVQNIYDRIQSTLGDQQADDFLAKLHTLSGQTNVEQVDPGLVETMYNDLIKDTKGLNKMLLKAKSMDSSFNQAQSQKGIAVARELLQRYAYAMWVHDELTAGRQDAQVFGGAHQERVSQALHDRGIGQWEDGRLWLAPGEFSSLTPEDQWKIATFVSAETFGDYQDVGTWEKYLKAVMPFIMYPKIDLRRQVHTFKNNTNREMNGKFIGLSKITARYMLPIVVAKFMSALGQSLTGLGGDEEDRSFAEEMFNWGNDMTWLPLIKMGKMKYGVNLQTAQGEFLKRAGIAQLFEASKNVLFDNVPSRYQFENVRQYAAGEGLKGMLETVGQKANKIRESTQYISSQGATGVTDWFNYQQSPLVRGTRAAWNYIKAEPEERFQNARDFQRTGLGMFGKIWSKAITIPYDVVGNAVGRGYYGLDKATGKDVSATILNYFNVSSKDRVLQLMYEYRYSTLPKMSFSTNSPEMSRLWKEKKRFYEAVYLGDERFAKKLFHKIALADRRPGESDDTLMHRMLRTQGPYSRWQLTLGRGYTAGQPAHITYNVWRAGLGRDDQLRSAAAYNYYGKMLNNATAMFGIDMSPLVRTRDGLPLY